MKLAESHGDGCICEPCNEAREAATAELNRRRKGKHPLLSGDSGPDSHTHARATWCVGCGFYCGPHAPKGCGFSCCKNLSSRPQPWRYFAEFPKPEVTS